MKLLPQVVCLGVLIGCTTVFGLPTADSSDQTSAEVVETEFGSASQTIILTDSKTHQQLAKLTVSSDSMGGPLKASDITHILWNPKRTAFVLQTHRLLQDTAVFVCLKAPGITANCYLSDSHPNACSELDFEWNSDSELTASYLDQLGKVWVEQWLISFDSFQCRPRIVAGQPTKGA